MIDTALVGRKALLITRDLTDLAPLARTPLAEYLEAIQDVSTYLRAIEDYVKRTSGG